MRRFLRRFVLFVIVVAAADNLLRRAREAWPTRAGERSRSVEPAWPPVKVDDLPGGAGGSGGVATGRDDGASSVMGADDPPAQPASPPAGALDAPVGAAAEGPPSLLGADDPEPPVDTAVASDSATSTATTGAPAPSVADASWVTPGEDGSCPAGYPVKVKVRSGIYHQPGGLNYERTTPDRCYASEAMAEAHGFRAAKR